MANLSESALWENGIYQLETNDPVEGGALGVSNRQARQLGNRTLWLKQQLEQSLFSNGYVEITSATTLGNAQVGKTILVSGEPGYTITLPLASEFQNKAFFVAHNESAAVWSLDRIYDIVATGADTIDICGTTRVKAQLKPNGHFWLVAGASTWHVIGNSPLEGVGSISIFANPATSIKGWLYCLGQNVSRTTYYDLFTVIGTTFGAGDGSTTFRLPDFRGEFIRGWDDTRGVDPGRQFGSVQTIGFGGSGLSLQNTALLYAIKY
jgi:hypothetical protein